MQKHEWMNKILSQEEWTVMLQDEYIDKKKGTETIAKEYCCGATTVKRWLVKCGIRVRGPAETQRGVRKKGTHKTCKAQLIRTSTKYIEWRLAVYERDGFACVGCGDKRGMNLQAHHILHFASHPNERFNVDNGTTLCRECHGKVHPNLKFVGIGA